LPFLVFVAVPEARGASIKLFRVEFIAVEVRSLTSPLRGRERWL